VPSVSGVIAEQTATGSIPKIRKFTNKQIVAGISLVHVVGWILLVVGTSNWWSEVGEIRNIHADSLNVYPPGETTYDYWKAPWDSSRFNPFPTDSHLLQLVYIAPYLGSVSAIGLAVLRVGGISRQLNSIAGEFAAGFLTGYVLLLSFIRVIFYMAPISSASRVSYLAILFGGVLSLRGLNLHRRNYLPQYWAKSIAMIVIAVFSSFIYRIQSGRNFLVSDSLIVFLDQIRSIKQNPLVQYLPTWDQQSDEWIFSAPGIFLSKNVGAEALWIVATNACAFVALVTILALTANYLLEDVRRKRLAQWSAVGFSILGTTAIIPVLNISLIGGQNPMIYLGHAGRFVGVVSPLIGYAIGQNSESGKPQRKLLLTAIISLGFGFLSPQAFFYFLIGITLGITSVGTLQINPGSKAVSLNSGRSQTVGLLPLFVFTTGVVVYGFASESVPAGTGHGPTSFKFVGFLLIVPIILCSCWMVSSIARLNGFVGLKRIVLRAATDICASCLMYLCGLFLSGNMVGYSGVRLRLINYLQSVLPGLATPLLSRGISVPFEFSELGQYGGLQCWISVYCASPSGFVFAVAFPLVLASIAALIAILDDRRSVQSLGLVVVVVTSLLMASLFLVDFTGGDQLLQIWGKTRFLEAPLYLLMFFSVLSIGRILPIFACTIAVLWTLPTVIQVIPQWYANLNWLVSQIV